MNDTELKKKFKSVAGMLLYKKKYIAPVDLLIGIGFLTQKNYEEWRKGNIPFMEKACSANLHKLSRVMKLLRQYAKQHNLRASWTAYMSWGKKQKKRKLQFSKSGKRFIEDSYATHYLSPYLKPKKEKKDNNDANLKKEKEINPTQESFAETYIMDRILNNYNEYYFYDDEFSDNDIIDEPVIEDDDDFTDNDVVAEPVIEDDDRVIPDLSDDVPF